jgi:hypothetical protein
MSDTLDIRGPIPLTPASAQVGLVVSLMFVLCHLAPSMPGTQRASVESRSTNPLKEKIEMKSSQVVSSVPIKADLQKTELQDQIRARAYQLYEQRGRDDGHSLDDWLKAEAESSQVQKAA